MSETCSFCSKKGEYFIKTCSDCEITQDQEMEDYNKEFQQLQTQNKLLLEFTRKTFECDAENESLVCMNWVHLVESPTGKQVAKLLEERNPTSEETSRAKE